MSNAGKNLGQKPDQSRYLKYEVGINLMGSEVQETQMRFYVHIWPSVYCQSDGVIVTHSLALSDW